MIRHRSIPTRLIARQITCIVARIACCPARGFADLAGCPTQQTRAVRTHCFADTDARRVSGIAGRPAGGEAVDAKHSGTITALAIGVFQTKGTVRAEPAVGLALDGRVGVTTLLQKIARTIAA